jgi:hypothetical protein
LLAYVPLKEIRAQFVEVFSNVRLAPFHELGEPHPRVAAGTSKGHDVNSLRILKLEHSISMVDTIRVTKYRYLVWSQTIYMPIFNGKNNTCFCAYYSLIYSRHENDGNNIYIQQLLWDRLYIVLYDSPHVAARYVKF